MRDNSKCSATTKFPRNSEDGKRSKQGVGFQSSCTFPFINKNVKYHACIKRKKFPGTFWCATRVNARNQKTKWGVCNDLCPKEEENISKANEVLVKFPFKLVVVILVGVLLLIIGIIICYCCIKKKKCVSVKNAEVNCGNATVTDEYTLDPIMTGNQAMINSDMILNEQAALLSYRGDREIERSKFEMSKKLGGGSFGSVYEGTTDNPIQPGQKIKVAIKTVNNYLDQSQVYALMCEIKVLEKLEKHLNLVNMIGACTAGYKTGRLWLLLEYCPCGDMKHFLNKNRDVFEQGLLNQDPHKSLNIRLFVKWGYGIAKGMDYLSSKKIMHGDLAARNILISNLDHEDYVAKITDFGLSKAFYDKTSYAKQDRRNIPWKWMDVDFLEASIFTMSSDVWSFGVVFWEMLL